MSGSSHKCSYTKCSSNNNNQEAASHLLGCSRCKSVKYCSTDCQKKDWTFHKFKCVAPEVTRHVINHHDDGGGIEAIQSAINAASPGDIIVIKKGSYGNPLPSAAATSDHNPPCPTLVVNKPIHLWGGGEEDRDDVVLNCNLEIDESGIISGDNNNDGSSAAAVVVLADFVLNGTTSISSNNYKSVTLCNVAMKCPSHVPNDALVINECKQGKCLILGCEIYGGSDGVFIASDGVHLKRSSIRHAQSRGIFSRRDFIIEDCKVSGCGGYGIKGSAGWTEKGRHNDIQPGPWSSWGGASDSYYGFGGW